jgi:HD-GYP domain-containing protein (c-di-GMP phosphodiesterase class II)
MPDSHIALTGVGPKVEGLHWEAETLLRIGRHATAEVVIQDVSVDRLHVEFKFHGQRWMVRPLTENPYFPTLLNGQPLSNRGTQVRLGDVLLVGKLKFLVSSLGSKRPDDEPAPAPASAAEVTPIPKVRKPKSSVDPPAPVAVEPAAPPPPAPPILAPNATRPGLLVLTNMLARPEFVDRAVTPASAADMQVLRVEASTQRSWDQALEDATAGIGNRPDSGRAMLTLLRANHHLSNVSRLDDLLQNILVDALGALDAQRAAILLIDPQTGQLELKARYAPQSTVASMKCHSKTLAERCFRQGESILCRDLRADQDPLAARSANFGSMASILCALLRTSRQKIGVLHLDRGPLQDPFSESDLYLADTIAANVAVGIECAQRVDTQSSQFLHAVTTLARAVEIRDQYTGDHTKRVTDFALLLADELKLAAPDRHFLQIGTPLYDLGKIGIEDAILRKPGKLTDGEFELMKSHTVKGAAMLDGFSSLAPVIPILRHHHERWDGSGYPDNLGRDKIALTARIVAVADAFDAMTSQRPYRPALPPQLAFLELLSKAGTHFDPQIVQAFLRLRPKVEDLMRSYAQGT